MIRTHYFEDSCADEGDHILRDEITLGTVPPTCLLGGHLVAAWRINGGDPCSECDGPRDRCRGRAKATMDEERDGAPEPFKSVPSENSSSRRDRRRMTVEQLWRIAHAHAKSLPPT